MQHQCEICGETWDADEEPEEDDIEFCSSECIEEYEQLMIIEQRYERITRH